MAMPSLCCGRLSESHRRAVVFVDARVKTRGSRSGCARVCGDGVYPM